MIPGGATLTLEAKVNLGNYESIGVGLSGECRTPEEADGLLSYFDQVLGRLAPEDAETKARITSWRSRVLGGVLAAPVVEREAPGIPEATVSTIAVPGMAEPVKVIKVQAPAAEKVPHVPSSAPAAEPEVLEDPDPEPSDEDLAALAPEPTPVSSPSIAKAAPALPVEAPKKAAPAPSGMVCEGCGTPVSKKQATTSRLFLSRIACEDCVKKANEARPGERL